MVGVVRSSLLARKLNNRRSINTLLYLATSAQFLGVHNSSTYNSFVAASSTTCFISSSSVSRTSLRLSFSSSSFIRSLSLKVPDTDTDTAMSNSNFKQSIRVVSYNLLSSHLAAPSHHTKCDPDHLQADNRFPKIIAKLQREIENSSHHSSSDSIEETAPVVFCLQEVSHDWARQLHVFFAERGYHFITALYGRKFSGYMGIGTAYPTAHFQTLDVDLCRLSDTRKGGWPKPREDLNQPSLFSKFIYNPLMSAAQSIGVLSIPPTNPWEKSQYRSNEFIAVQLQRRNKQQVNNNQTPPIWIGNYHMPCAFREPAIMTIHCDLVAKRIQDLAKNDAFILAGDFNITPDSPHYTFLTSGQFNQQKDDSTSSSSPSPYPPIRYGVEWQSNIQKMKSAYALHNNGKESDFTNYAHNGAMSDESFIDTLDYIFLSDDHEWNVKDVHPLRHRDDVKDGPFPNADEPSDHVMIAATLQL